MTPLRWAGWKFKRRGFVPWPAQYTDLLSAPSRTERESATTIHHWWNKHVNRRVLHHSSFTAWAGSIGILKKTSRTAGLMDSHDGLGYGVRPFDAQDHVQAYSQLHAQATLLKSLPVPKTNAQWVEAMSMADTRAKQQRLPMPENKWPWLVRFG